MTLPELLAPIETRAFNKTYDTSLEDEANAQRAEFLELFPRERLHRLKLPQYAIGQGRSSFCYWLEQGTQAWAEIGGVPAKKFGVYFGRDKSSKINTEPRYRATGIWLDDVEDDLQEDRAFQRIRRAIIDLLVHGESLNFALIDQSHLSQMFKAKILSLYFPDFFINICAKEQLFDIAKRLGWQLQSPSEIQHRLLGLKQRSALTRSWGPIKLTTYLLEAMFVEAPNKTKKRPSERNHPEVDYVALQAARDQRGKDSEKFAFEFEKRRLRSAGMSKLINKIEDRTKRPGYGYDIESFTDPRTKRYIEVKSLRELRDGNVQFFLSGNERKVAESAARSDQYYFYLVEYSGSQPIRVRVKWANMLWTEAIVQPVNDFVVTLAKAKLR